MAKELPYFKFEPGQWENGTIQLCSREYKGLFIDLCSMYWQRLGDLPYKLALQKLCAGNATALDSLCEAEIISVNEGLIHIDFLDEQLHEFESISKSNSKNARLGWQKRKKNATPVRPHSDGNAIRGEERRGEEKREDSLKDWIEWADLIVNENDQHWEAMKGRKVSRDEMNSFLSVATRNQWKFTNQAEFRVSLNGFKLNGHETKQQKNKYKIQ